MICSRQCLAAILASLKIALIPPTEDIMRKRGSKSQEHVVFQGPLTLQGGTQASVKLDWESGQHKDKKRESAEESYFSERMGEPNRSDLARLYYHLRTPTPDNAPVPRRLRPLSLSGAKGKSRTMREDGEDIVDQMEIRLHQAGSEWEALDIVEAGWTQLQRAIEGEAREWLLTKRLIAAYRRIANTALSLYEEEKTLREAHRCPQVPNRASSPPKEISLVEKLVKQTETKRQLEELEDYLEADAEAYKELQVSIESLLQVHSSGTAEYLRLLYQEMSHKHSLPEPNHFTELPPMELQEWENSLRLRFK